MGKGTGKGGCRSCCSAAVCFPIIWVLVGIVGIGLVAGGIGALVGGPILRNQQIQHVQNAVDAWNSPNASTGWRAFQNLAVSVYISSPSVTVVSLVNTPCQAANKTLPLTPSACPTDIYDDEAGRFQSVKQLSYCAAVDWALMSLCSMKVDFQVLQPNAAAPTVVASLFSPVLTAAGTVTVQMNELDGFHYCGAGKNCEGSKCASKCADEFGGSYDCGKQTCRTSLSYVDSLAIKVNASGNGSWALDTVNPGLGSASGGANILPSGYSWNKSSNGVTVRGAAWAYEGLTYVAQPTNLTFQLRSSSDPWLAYMSETDGSGSFGLSKSAYVGIGAGLITAGGLLLLGVLLGAVCCCWGRSIARDSYHEKPSGCVRGIAWSWGRLMLGRQYQPANANAYAVPMAQAAPAYAYPPQGAPPPGGAAAPPPAGYYAYPPPPPGGPQPAGAYGAPQGGAYPAYPPNNAYGQGAAS